MTKQPPLSTVQDLKSRSLDFISTTPGLRRMTCTYLPCVCHVSHSWSWIPLPCVLFTIVDVNSSHAYANRHMSFSESSIYFTSNRSQSLIEMNGQICQHVNQGMMEYSSMLFLRSVNKRLKYFTPTGAAARENILQYLYFDQ